MKYYIIAGEASGDLHGSNLIKEIRFQQENAAFRCWGGDLMASSGAQLIKHYKDLAFMGFIEVIRNLPAILKNISFCKKDILAFNPDAIILIDYPGFNLRIAKWAKKNGFKVIYYISPQVWAWKEKRVELIKKCVDKMLVILPFEKEFYSKWNYEVEYVGHPLVEVIDRFCLQPKTSKWEGQPLIALLPGSRKQELLVKLPIMLDVSRHFPQYQFVVAKAPGIPDEFYEHLLKAYPNVSTIKNETYSLLQHAAAALVTSGTATLETALFGVPEIICYKGNAISFQIAKRLVKIKFIGLVNLIMNKEVVKELIQNELTTNHIVTELKLILENNERRNQITADYAALKSLLSSGGNASKNAAKIICDFTSPSPTESTASPQ